MDNLDPYSDMKVATKTLSGSGSTPKFKSKTQSSKALSENEVNTHTNLNMNMKTITSYGEEQDDSQVEYVDKIELCNQSDLIKKPRTKFTHRGPLMKKKNKAPSQDKIPMNSYINQDIFQTKNYDEAIFEE